MAYTKYIQVKEELQKQKTFVANLQQMYNASQEQLKEESRKKRMAEIRCKFLEQKNRGLFNRCKEYAEGRVPSGSLASFGVDMDHKTYVERKMRGTQFRFVVCSVLQIHRRRIVTFELCRSHRDHGHSASSSGSGIMMTRITKCPRKR